MCITTPLHIYALIGIRRCSILFCVCYTEEFLALKAVCVIFCQTPARSPASDARPLHGTGQTTHSQKNGGGLKYMFSDCCFPYCPANSSTPRLSSPLTASPRASSPSQNWMQSSSRYTSDQAQSWTLTHFMGFWLGLACWTFSRFKFRWGLCFFCVNLSLSLCVCVFYFFPYVFFCLFLLSVFNVCMSISSLTFRFFYSGERGPKKGTFSFQNTMACPPLTQRTARGAGQAATRSECSCLAVVHTNGYHGSTHRQHPSRREHSTGLVGVL